VQEVRQIGATTDDLVVHRDRADDRAHAAGLGRPHAQQSDHVGRVGVVVQAGPRLESAHARVVRVDAEVADVDEQVVLALLVDRHPDMPAHPPVEKLDLPFVEIGNRDPTDEDEAPPVDEFIDKAGQERTERRQRKVGGADVAQRHLGPVDARQGRPQLGDMIRGELDPP
jgi:hypothetical protein